MNKKDASKAFTVTDKSIIGRLWLKLLAKRKHSISARVLAVFLIILATLLVWAIQLLITFACYFAYCFFEALANGEDDSSTPLRDDPFGDFSMSYNGYD